MLDVKTGGRPRIADDSKLALIETAIAEVEPGTAVARKLWIAFSSKLGCTEQGLRTMVARFRREAERRGKKESTI